MKKLLVMVLLCCCSICFTLAQAQTPEKQFTLEQVMSAPFPSDLVAARSGSKVAWVQNAKGVRNVWVAEPPEYKGRQLTSYSEDDGEEIDQGHPSREVDEQKARDDPAVAQDLTAFSLTGRGKSGAVRLSTVRTGPPMT